MSLGLKITNVTTSTVLAAGSRVEYVKEHDLVPARVLQPAPRIRATYARQIVRGNHANLLTATIAREYQDFQHADRGRYALAEQIRQGLYDGHLLLTWPDGTTGYLMSAVLQQAPKVRKIGSHLEIVFTWQGREWTGPGGTLADLTDPGGGPPAASVDYLLLEADTAGSQFLLDEKEAELIQLENN